MSVDSVLLTYGTDYTVDSGQIVLIEAPAVEALIKIYRQTPTTQEVEWADGSVLKAYDLTKFQIQLLHLSEELADMLTSGHITTTTDGTVWDALLKRLTNLADPVDAQDAVTKNYMENVQGSFVQANTALRDEALRAETNARTSANSALTSSINASNSEIKAKESEEKAKTSETNASNSEVNAKTYMETTKGYMETTEGYKTTAGESATVATDAEANAKTYQDNAYTYMVEARSYMNSASESATKASDSELSAGESATLATDAEANAKTYMDNAKTYMETASTYATKASASETASYKSSLSASTSASNASESAQQAQEANTGIQEALEEAQTYAQIAEDCAEEIKSIAGFGITVISTRLRGEDEPTYGLESTSAILLSNGTEATATEASVNVEGVSYALNDNLSVVTTE